MLVNNSSSFLSDFSNPSYFIPCSDSTIFSYIIFFFQCTNIIFLLPLSIFVLFLGYQQWKQLHSRSSATYMSFSDIFAYNMAVMELIGIIGFTLCICGGVTYNNNIISVGIFISIFPWCGHIFFPILTCVERYVAVIHPINYMQLKQGVRIRNISIGLVWLLCFLAIIVKGLMFKYTVLDTMVHFGLMIFSSIGVSFCCLSVLFALIRPRPGEAGGKKERIYQSKQRAVIIIMVIMAVLMLRFGGNVVCDVIVFVPSNSYSVRCIVTACRYAFSLPCSLVLPLLFLQRVGKLPGFKCNTESG